MRAAAGPSWHTPTSLDEAVRLRAELADQAVVVAGGTFVGLLLANGMLAPEALLSLGGVPGLDHIRVVDDELELGALVTHRQVERSPQVRRRWPALADTFAAVASPRIRTQATVGGVLADADYASDPPAMLTALGARARLIGPAGARTVPVADLIVGHYETVIGDDELLVDVTVPPEPTTARYLKFRTRSSEDRPCVGVALTADVADDGECRDLRVVVGAVSSRPQWFPDICAEARGRPLAAPAAAAVAAGYADAITPLDDHRGSAAYRTRLIEVLVGRAMTAGEIRR